MSTTTHDRDLEAIIREDTDLDYHALNAMLNLYDADVRIQFERDKQAARQFFLQYVNTNTVFFHDLEEKLAAAVDTALVGEAALLRVLEQRRTGAMGDIVATLHATDGELVVGKGKATVAEAGNA